MSWNYRVIEFVSPGGDPWRAIHEVFYHDDGSLKSYSENPAIVVTEHEGGPAKRELGEVLDAMRGSLSKRVLVERDFQRVPDEKEEKTGDE